MDKNTMEGKTILQWMCDVLANALISHWKSVCKFTTNIDKMCIELMHNTSLFSIRSIIMN